MSAKEADLTETLEAAEPGRGRSAATPGEIPAKGMRDVFWRVVSEISEERVFLIAAGVSFYLLLALFPALGALVSLYGFVANPSDIGSHMAVLDELLPPGSYGLITDQLKSLTTQKTATLSLGFIGGLLVSLWSAANGIAALFDAMNVAYGEKEKRGIVSRTLLCLAFTFAALLFAVVLIVAIGVLPALLAYLWLDRWIEILTRVARWPAILLLSTLGVVLIYRYGPSRERAKLRWLNWGAVFSTLLWLAASWIYSYYLENFANYNATYGALGALIGFMMWVWISMVILITGALVNAELEHQTAVDSTTGEPLPMGDRGAYVADTLGKAAD
ncbi:ribonuclease [Sinorhizobium fredii USDA 205]|uniref:YihY family inner membrane protein n=1 Tax=Rhizobium fredii TaxID=380 RepID=A0A844AD86_RHIFR|nr:YihY/virulence factor BrkB family protein [Sinorhizobium fredii]KSV85327.1 ribonuclease [Sinorhizobium fredii USDA 205]MQW98568.1 YihY family inner membrane protein [Sinorhizobium fredii]MQX10487.1 YihY family inner membrane protein [Sinorhizobium fredii]UTY46100.1 YihY/virulence factor BrkB family protein [Sinorhizobium fredii]GEC34442.1 ribonuclease [Sinorhizobium fredii]